MRTPPLRLRPISLRLATGLVAGVLLAGVLAVVVLRGEEPIALTADFGDTTGLYVGNDVHYLGVPVGEVVAVEPRGTTMRVHLEIDPDTELPAEAAAEILQSSLVTDRLVELGPPYDGGPRLTSGAHIAATHTRSPATIDEITRTLDELVLALDSTTPEGRDIGDLLSVAADGLDGNGERIRDALVAGEEALRSVNAKGEDIAAVLTNLVALSEALAERDVTLRRFTGNLARSSEVVAEQRESLTTTTRALDRLSRLVTDFVEENQEVVVDDVRQSLRLVRQVRERQESLTEAFDVMPTLAENIARAYDFRTERLRVQFSFAVGPFSRVARATLCRQYAGSLCDLLLRDDGTGALDPLLDALFDAIPGGIP